MPSGHPDTGKFHPLTAHALGELRRIMKEPVPTQSVNAGVVQRLGSEALVEHVQLASPYAIHKGKKIDHLKATAAGISRAAVGPRSVT